MLRCAHQIHYLDMQLPCTKDSLHCCCNDMRRQPGFILAENGFCKVARQTNIKCQQNSGNMNLETSMHSLCGCWVTAVHVIRGTRKDLSMFQVCCLGFDLLDRRNCCVVCILPKALHLSA